MLWRPVDDAAPLAAVFAGESRVELAYPDRREIRDWPSFGLLGTVPAGSGQAPPGRVAEQVTRALGGSVDAVSVGPSGLAAALWTEERYPPWYRVVVWSGSCRAMTPASARIWGRPCWSSTGALAVTAFDGIRRGIFLVSPADGSAPPTKPG